MDWLANLPPVPTSQPVPLPARPAMPSSSTAAPAVQARQQQEDKICVVCMDAEAVAGVLHKVGELELSPVLCCLRHILPIPHTPRLFPLQQETVHKCLCKECAQELKDNNVRLCPMCREQIEAFIMHVYG